MRPDYVSVFAATVCAFLLIAVLYLYPALFPGKLVLLPAKETGVEISHYEKIQAKGVLRVLVTPSLPGFYPNERRVDPLDLKLMASLADEMQLTLQPVFADSRDSLFNKLATGKADVALLGPLFPESIPENVDASTPYLLSTAHVIDRQPGYSSATKVSSCIDSARLQADGYAKLDWWLSTPNDRDPLTGRLRKPPVFPTPLNRPKQDGCQLASDRELQRIKQLDPRFRVVTQLQRPMLSVVLTSITGDLSLRNKINEFISRIRDDGSLEAWQEQLSLLDADAPDAMPLHEAVLRRLPEYLPMFQQVGERTKIDWRLLAALGYQESHWNPAAVSRTGVRGLMMLTEQAAEEMQIANRASARQSIGGGAEYMRKMLDQLSREIPPQDRLWFALAAYNLGYGHLEDARKLTQTLGDDPNRWNAVKEHLPKLAKSRWNRMTRYGHARGTESVRFVDNIRFYYDILRLRYPLPPEPSVRHALG